MKILAIETSCDETSCAVVEDGRVVLSNVTATQIDEHSLYGGVVPEIASRRHCENIVGVCEAALVEADCRISRDIDAVAVTYAPGLIGALLVGVNFAKGLAAAHDKPLIPVHHIKAHIASNYLSGECRPPFLAVVVSGGHTSLIHARDYTDFSVIGATLDDAAGEAFDKAARAMGFPYPGGVYIDRESVNGDAHAYKLPFPKTANSFDFSFSGLKTAVINLIHNTKQTGGSVNAPDLAASFQYTVCEMITSKAIAAARHAGADTLCLSGGVAANGGLRAALLRECDANGFTLHAPPLCYCGDNAAMVGSQAYYEYTSTILTADMSLNAYATLGL